MAVSHLTVRLWLPYPAYSMAEALGANQLIALSPLGGLIAKEQSIGSGDILGFQNEG